MSSVMKQHAHKVVQVAQIMAVGDAFWFNYEQALEGMDNFLKDFPMLRGMLNSIQIPHYYFIDLFVFLYENQNQVMGRLSDLRLNYDSIYILIRQQSY